VIDKMHLHDCTHQQMRHYSCHFPTVHELYLEFEMIHLYDPRAAQLPLRFQYKIPDSSLEFHSFHP